MKTFVLDTSVVVKWYSQEDEPGLENSQRILREMKEGQAVFIVPSLLVIELLNVLIKSKKLKERALKDALRNFYSLPLVIKEPSQGVLDRTIDLAVTLDLTSYDSLFLALAESENCQLITSDNKMAEKSTREAVLLLDSFN